MEVVMADAINRAKIYCWSPETLYKRQKLLMLGREMFTPRSWRHYGRCYKSWHLAYLAPPIANVLRNIVLSTIKWFVSHAERSHNKCTLNAYSASRSPLLLLCSIISSTSPVWISLGRRRSLAVVDAVVQCFKFARACSAVVASSAVLRTPLSLFWLDDSLRLVNGNKFHLEHRVLSLMFSLSCVSRPKISIIFIFHMRLLLWFPSAQRRLARSTGPTTKL